VRKLATSLLAILAAAMLAGCARRDSITVGAVPDDYRTNHPIVITEREEVLDLPVGTTDRGMTKAQRIALGGFLSGYDKRSAPPFRIMLPAGAVNERAAAHAAQDFAKFARKNGVPSSRIAIMSYQASAPGLPAPIRVSYTAMRAQTDQCGRWPEDLLKTEENKHYANFGCSYQNNLAAQVANPTDLLGPRKQTEIDAEKRLKVIGTYRGDDGAPGSNWEPEVGIDF
jgi:pilus assembly protein CpaD